MPHTPHAAAAALTSEKTYTDTLSRIRSRLLLTSEGTYTDKPHTPHTAAHAQLPNAELMKLRVVHLGQSGPLRAVHLSRHKRPTLRGPSLRVAVRR